MRFHSATYSKARRCVEEWRRLRRLRDYERIIVVVRLDPREKNVAIDEVRRPCHLAVPHRSFRARTFQWANSAVFPIPLPYLQACGEIHRPSLHPEAEN